MAATAKSASVLLKMLQFLCLIAGTSSQGEKTSLNFDCPENNQCLRVPETCAIETCECQAIVMVEKPPNGLLQFDMQRVGDGYIAVGISKDKLMGDDIVIACVRNGVHMIWNTFDENGNRTAILTNFMIEPKPAVLAVGTPIVNFTDGILSCRFILSSPPFEYAKGITFSFVDPIQYFLFLAMGQSRTEAPFIEFHARTYSDTQFLIWNTVFTEIQLPAIPFNCTPMNSNSSEILEITDGQFEFSSSTQSSNSAESTINILHLDLNLWEFSFLILASVFIGSYS